MIPVVRAVGRRTAAAPAVWSPASIPSLGGWWDASDAATFTYSSGTLVSQWSDKSGSGRHMAQANTGRQPSRSGTINSKSAVVFDGAMTGMATAVGATIPVPASLLVVARSTASGQRDVFMMIASDLDGDGRIFQTSGGTIDIYQGAFLSTGASWGTTVAHAVAAVLGGGSSKIAADSAAWTTGSSGGLTGQAALAIGSFRGGGLSEQWQGEVCEAVYVAAGISDADRASWFAYCATKWGTA